MRFLARFAFYAIVIGAAEFLVARLGVSSRAEPVLVALVLVAAGWAAERSGWLPRRTRHAPPGGDERRALRQHLAGTTGAEPASRGHRRRHEPSRCSR